MVKPLLESSIFGVVFYQGTGNLNYNLDYYGCTFTALINDWRNKWFIGTDGATDPQFPFGFVLNANMAIENVSIGNLPKLRWEQTAKYGYVPNPKMKNVFMASAVDLVDNYWAGYQDPLHPRCKQDIGIRLSLGALKMAYKMPVEFSPPRVLEISYRQDKFMKIIYDSATFYLNDLEVKSERGFEVCCDSKVCNPDQMDNWMPLLLSGFDHVRHNDTWHEKSIVFNKPENCNQPLFVRYLWRQKPCEFKQCPLYYMELPLVPFVLPVVPKY
jgi:sialate O-acetylesterase